MENYLTKSIKELEGAEFKVVYIIYSDINSSLGECRLTNNQMADVTGLGRSTVARIITNLVDRNILSRQTDKSLIGTDGLVRNKPNPRELILNGVDRKTTPIIVEDVRFEKLWKGFNKHKNEGSGIGDKQKAKKEFYKIKTEDVEEMLIRMQRYLEVKHKNDSFTSHLFKVLRDKEYNQEDYALKTPLVKSDKQLLMENLGMLEGDAKDIWEASGREGRLQDVRDKVNGYFLKGQYKKVEIKLAQLKK